MIRSIPCPGCADNERPDGRDLCDECWRLIPWHMKQALKDPDIEKRCAAFRNILSFAEAGLHQPAPAFAEGGAL